MDFVLSKDANEANYSNFLDFSNTRLKIIESDHMLGF